MPAAGTGSRLGASIPKFLVPVGGRPMIDRLLDLYDGMVSGVVLVVQPGWEGEARTRLSARGVEADVVVQGKPTGMLDAVLLARDAVGRSGAQRVWVTWCDQVAIHPTTVMMLAHLSDVHLSAPLVMPVALRAEPYIHFERNPTARIVGVRQRREGDAMPSVGESDAGVFSFSREAFLGGLPRYAASLEPGAATGERNLLPFIPWLAASGEIVTYPCLEDIEAVGINTPEELRRVEAALADREGPRT